MTKNKRRKGLALIDPEFKSITDPIEDIRKFKSDDEQNKAFIDNIKREVQAKLLLSNGKSSKFTNHELLLMMVKHLHLKALVEKNNLNHSTVNTFMILDVNNPIGIWKPFDVEKYVVILSTVIEIADISRTTSDIIKRLRNITPDLLNIETINLPPQGLIIAPNCIVNLKTLEQANDRFAFGNYDFIYSNKFNILPKDLVDPFMYEVVKRIHNDWTQDNDDAKTYLKQLEFAALEGYGRKVYHLLKGDGGNGKSTFLNILEQLAGPTYTVKLDLQNIMRDNSLANILSNNKLVIGHDMSTNSRVSHDMLSRFKEFTLGEPFQIEVKYQPNKLCKTLGLKVQNTNSDVAFLENSQAIKRRLIVFNWTNEDFSKLSTGFLNFNLDELVGTMGKPDPKFYEALIAYMFDDITYFDKFIQLKESEDYKNEMIANADQVYRFLVWMEEQDLMLMVKYPINALYQMYVGWMKDENQGSAPLKRRGFTDRLAKLVDQFGYEFVNERRKISSFSLKDFNIDLINKLYFNNSLKYNKYENTTYIQKKKEEISLEDINEFRSNLDTIQSSNELNFRELIMLYYLVDKGVFEAVALIETD